MTTWYQRLAVRPVINANTTLTSLGGSLMPVEVSAAMAEAALEFVEIDELEAAVGREIARLTRNEAALVTCGAAAGIFLSVLGCMAGLDEVEAARLTNGHPPTRNRREVVIQTSQRNPYDLAVTLAGAQVVQVGSLFGTTRLDLEAALSELTAAVLFFAGAHLARGALGLRDVIDVAHSHSIPVIVDAAAQLPPASNLWSLTADGADLVLFSGGKGMRGPGSTGLLVGSAPLVAAASLHASPRQRLGRPMKVSKEELVGLLAAVELFVSTDHELETERIEAATTSWLQRLARLSNAVAVREFPGEAGRPRPRVLVTISAEANLSGSTVRDRLLAGDPRVDVAVAGERSFYLNAEMLRPGEERVVLDRVLAVLGGSL